MDYETIYKLNPLSGYEQFINQYIYHEYSFLKLIKLDI